MVLKKAVYDKLFKEWRTWRNTDQKLPNRFLHPTRRKAFEAWNEMTWAGGRLDYKEDEIIKGGPLDGTYMRPSRVIRTGAGPAPLAKGFHPITITPTRITIDRRELKDQVNYYRWLLRHPGILKGMVSRYFYDRRTIQDSALFL